MERGALDCSLHLLTTESRLFLTWPAQSPLDCRGLPQHPGISDAEVNGLADFYSRPIGQVALRKIPLAMKNTIAELEPLLMQMCKRPSAKCKNTP
jgi:hypothetical protein